MATLFDGLLNVHYGQAYVVSGEAGDTGEMDAYFRGQSNGLLGAARPGELFLITGLHTGSVRLRVEVAEAPPAEDPSWEESVEATFTPGEGEVLVIDWDGNLVCELPLEPTSYRVRYEARAMDAGHEQDTILEGEEPIDAYRLSFWPAPSEPDRIVRATSEIASYWHDWATTGR